MELEPMQMYWQVDYNSNLKLYRKRLLYKSMFTPIWMYSFVIMEDWAKKSNTNIIQISQNKFLRTITNANRYVTNNEIHENFG